MTLPYACQEPSTLSDTDLVEMLCKYGQRVGKQSLTNLFPFDGPTSAEIYLSMLSVELLDRLSKSHHSLRIPD